MTHEIPVQARCSSLCALHCGDREDTIELSAADAGALLNWLWQASEEPFTPRSSSRLSVRTGADGGLVLKIAPWPAP